MAEFIRAWGRGYQPRLLLPRPAASIDTDFRRAAECVAKTVLSGLHHEYWLEKVAA